MDNRKEEVFEEKKDDLSYLKDEEKTTLKETLKVGNVHELMYPKIKDNRRKFSTWKMPHRFILFQS
jgi:hypothetical protein